MELLVTFTDSTYELNGIYRDNGTLNGYPSYKHESKEYYIFADADGQYCLNNTTTMIDPCYYYGPQGSAIGTYRVGVLGLGDAGAITVTEYVDSSGTITGFEVSGSQITISVDGTYTLTDYQSGYSADPRVFSNGTYYLARFSDNGGWYFGTTYTAAFSDTSSCKTYDPATFDTQYGSPTVANPSDVKNWWDLETFVAQSFSVTPIYGEDGEDGGNGDGDSEGGENTGNIIGYEVDGIGVTAFNGYYGYANDEYNSKPYYTLAASTGGTYYLYYSGDTSGWAIGTTLGGTPLWYQSTVSETPDGGTWTGTASTPPTSITPVYDTTGGGDTGEDGDGDSGEDDKTYVYTVSGAGSLEANGNYWELGETFTHGTGFEITPYTNGSCLLYYDPTYCYISRGTTSLPTQSSDVLYTRMRDSEDFLGTWNLGSGTDPVPTVTAYSEDVPDEPDTPDDPVLPDEDEPEKISAPAVGDKGIKINNVFIPVCPDPADCNFNRITEVGKAAAVGWLAYDFGNAVDIPAANVEYQAGLPGWVSVTVAGNNAALAVKVYPVSGSENTGTGFARSTATGDLQGTVFVPEGYFYKIVTANNIISAKFFPCGK